MLLPIICILIGVLITAIEISLSIKLGEFNLICNESKCKSNFIRNGEISISWKGIGQMTNLIITTMVSKGISERDSNSLLLK